jgi:hypothetical protein
MSATQTPETQNRISTFNEGPLHAALKAWYARPDDRLEAEVDGFIIDIVRGPLLIEIQTGSFSGIKDKLITLSQRHPVRLIYPIPREKWLVKLAREAGAPPKRRKSPKRGRVEDLFQELVSFPELLKRPDFEIEVLFTQEDEVRRYDPRRGWRRRGWVTEERRLLKVVERRRFTTPDEMAALLPGELTETFTTADLADALARSRRLAQKMAYCLRKMGALAPIGKQGRAILYARSAVR